MAEKGGEGGREEEREEGEGEEAAMVLSMS